MKKILFIIISIFLSVQLFAEGEGKTCYKYQLVSGHNYWSGQDYCSSQQWPVGPTSYACYIKGAVSCDVAKSEYLEMVGAIKGYGGLLFVDMYGNFTNYPNPQPNSTNSRCEDTFIKDGKFYNCNPSTNEATFVENSDGYEEKEDGIYPKCLTGYEAHNIGRLTSSGTENQFYCLKSSNDSPDSWVGQTPVDTSSVSGTYNTNSDGTISWTGTNGNDYSYSPSTGVLLESNFKTGSASAHAVGSSFTPGSSYTPNGLGYAPNPDGTYGNTGTGGEGTGTGTGENPNPTNPDTPIDETPAANSCDDVALTLQERMLCEMNAGVKKLNSESSPSNSLNQLMKDLNNKSTQNNDSLDVLKNNTNVINENLDATNTKLDKLNTNTNNTNTKLDNLNTTLGTLNTTLKDIEKNTKSTSTSLGGSNDGSGGTGEENNGENGEDGSSYNGDLENVNSDLTTSYNDFVGFYNDMKSSYTNLTNQISNAQNVFKNGFTFNPIKNIVNSSNLEQCLTVSVFGKDVLLDWISPLIYIKPITTILIQFLMFLEVGRMFSKIINYTRSVF